MKVDTNRNIIYSMTGYNDGRNGVKDKVDIQVFAKSEIDAIEKARKCVKREHYIVQSVRCTR